MILGLEIPAKVFEDYFKSRLLIFNRRNRLELEQDHLVNTEELCADALLGTIATAGKSIEVMHGSVLAAAKRG